MLAGKSSLFLKSGRKSTAFYQTDKSDCEKNAFLCFFSEKTGFFLSTGQMCALFLRDYSRVYKE